MGTQGWRGVAVTGTGRRLKTSCLQVFRDEMSFRTRVVLCRRVTDIVSRGGRGPAESSEERWNPSFTLRWDDCRQMEVTVLLTSPGRRWVEDGTPTGVGYQNRRSGRRVSTRRRVAEALKTRDCGRSRCQTCRKRAGGSFSRVGLFVRGAEECHQAVARGVVLRPAAVERDE